MIPLLVPRDQCKYTLLYQKELRPFVGIACPEPTNMHGRGCKSWRRVEVFAVDEIDPNVVVRLQHMGVDLKMVGPIIWDNIDTWKLEAFSKTRIVTWLAGDTKVYHDALVVRGLLAGFTAKEAGQTVRTAISDGIVQMLRDTAGRYLRLSKPRKGSQLQIRKRKNYGPEPTQGCAEPPGGVTEEAPAGDGPETQAVPTICPQPV
jgi:hypothetical protein